MKYMKKISLLSLFAAVSLLGKIAVIDTDKIMNPEDPALSGSLQCRDDAAAFQRWLDDKQAPFKAAEQKFNTKQQQLDEKAKAGKQPTDAERNELMSMYQSLTQQAQDIQAQIQEKLQALRASTLEITASATRTVCSELGFDEAMDKRLLISYNPAHDITDTVIKELNAKYEAKKRAEKMQKAAAPAKAKP